MDDATLQRIAKIVDDMQAQGMSEAEIKEQLSQMGLSEMDVAKLLPPAEPEEITPPRIDEATPSKPLSEEHLQPAIDKLDEHGDHLERLHTTVGELHDKTDSLSLKTDDIKALKKEIQELRSSLNEIKSLMASMKTINNKLLDINNKMLTKLAVK